MKSQFIRGILVIFGAFLFFSALADERFFLDDQQKSIVLGKHFLFLQDNTKSLTIDNILSHKLDDRFQQGTRDIISVGYADADYWLQFPTLTNLSKSSQWYIAINGYATDTMKNLAFYFITEGRLRHVEYIPDVAAHQIANRFPAISVAIPPELLAAGDLQIFMRVEIYGLTNFPIILTKNKIAHSYHKEVIFASFFIGAIILLLIFNFFIFNILKDRSYLFYIFYLLSWIIVGAIGYYKFEVFLGVRLGYEITLVGYALSVFFIVVFSYEFLEVKKNCPVVGYFMLLLVVFDIAVAGIVFFNAILGYQLLSILGVLMTLTIFVAAMVCLYKKQRQARLFSIGWLFYMLSLILWIIYNNGILEYTIVLANIHLVGSLVETTFLSFALVDKYYLLRLEMNQTYERLKKANVQMIQAFGTTVEKRDPYTAGHQFRVSNLAEAIAKQMNLEEDFVESVKLSALIHDIGKIGISKNLLKKKHKLSGNEFQKIKKHVQIGYEIIEHLDISQNIKDGILHHHERLDGSGYPNGIKKDKISLIGKILAVADTVEAVTNARPYRFISNLKR